MAERQSDLVTEPPMASAPSATDALLDEKFRSAFQEQEAKQRPLIEEMGAAQIEQARIERQGIESGQGKMKEGFASYQEQIKAPQEFIRKGFEPTRENSTDLTALFATTAIAAFMGGGGGRYSGMAALNNMAGAMEGYRKGRKDLFDRELKEFDKNFKAAQTSLQTASDELKSVVEIAKLDPVLAQAKAKEYAAKYAGTKLAYDFNKGSFDQKIKTATELEKAALKLEEAKAKVEGKGGTLKATAEPTKRFELARDSLESVLSIEEKLKNAKVRKEFDDSQILRVLLESPREMFPLEKFIKTSIYQKLSPDSQKLFSEIATARNDYYRAISGQAVTGSEGARNFFAVIQPTDNSESLLNKIENQKKKYERQVFEFVQGYEVPDVVKQSVNELILRSQGSARAGTQNVDTLRKEAQDAITKGANKDAVKKRFKDLTGMEL